MWVHLCSWSYPPRSYYYYYYYHSEYKVLVTKRAVLKRKITLTLKQVPDEDSAFDYENGFKLISSYLSDIKVVDNLISDIICSLCFDGSIPDSCETELEGQSKYLLDIESRLNQLRVAEDSEVSSAPANIVSDCNLRLPDLRCDYFSGEGSNELQFHSFLTQFNNVIGFRNNLSKSTKLTYLKTYLKGYALKTLQHLQITDSNYDVAISLLSKEFLNRDALVDELIKKLFALKPKTSDYGDVKTFINDVRCIIGDLKCYDYDFVNCGASKVLVSHWVFNNLPASFKTELVRKLGNSFPSINEIFDNYVEVIRTLNLQTSKASSRTYDKCKTYNAVTVSKNVSIKDNVKVVNKYCKFCTATSHAMLHCRKYCTPADRTKRCAELSLCNKCSSSKHSTDRCSWPLDFACFFCSSKNHISALCFKYVNKITSNFCINNSTSAGETFVLPIVNVTVGHGKAMSQAKFLFDSGSQRSYISSDVLSRLNMDKTELNKTELLISTFIDTSCKEFTEISLAVTLGSKEFVLPFLISDDVKLTYTINGLGKACANIHKKFPTSEVAAANDVVQLEGLLGVDAIQCFKDFELLPCLGGSVFKLGDQVTPVGNVDNFLTDKQLRRKYSCNDTAIPLADNSANIDKSIVNFVLSPTKSYFDPIGVVTEDSSVEDRLDKLFSVESLGISEDSSDYDKHQIDNFNSGISFKDGKYSVILPWTDKIDEVQCNYNVCFAILQRVLESLHTKGIYDEYDKILQQQLSDDILEPVSLENIDLKSHVFIPHRPVVKTADQVTSKIRIVLNCSLKIKDSQFK